MHHAEVSAEIVEESDAMGVGELILGNLEMHIENSHAGGIVLLLGQLVRILLNSNSSGGQW